MRRCAESVWETWKCRRGETYVQRNKNMKLGTDGYKYPGTDNQTLPVTQPNLSQDILYLRSHRSKLGRVDSQGFKRRERTDRLPQPASPQPAWQLSPSQERSGRKFYSAKCNALLWKWRRDAFQTNPR